LNRRSKFFVRDIGGIALVYRLLAIDIDGTLLRSNHRIDRQTREAIQYVQEKGVYVTLATGRNFPSAKKVADSLKLDSVLITHNGGFLASDIEEPEYANRFEEEKVYQIVQLLENYDCHIRVLHEKYSVGNRVRQKNHLIAKMTLGIGDPLFYPSTFTDKLSNQLLESPIASPKIDVQFFDEVERQSARNHLEKIIPGIHITSSTKCNFEIMPEGVNKAKGIQVLGEKLGISLDEVVAVGDSYNDIDMITQAGLGVAMGNAPKEVKQAADWVTRSNNQRGVAYAVKEVFRKQLKYQIVEPLKY
jgi:Cof subfamily protein (haloacid dehalogenase superfamily)